MGYFKDKGKMEEFMKGAVQDQNQIEVLRADIRSILGEGTFEGIYAFFEGIFSGDFNVVVLMSRRCLVLCQIFMTFLAADGKNGHPSTLVFCDKAIPYCHQKLRDGKIAIVDDILIHGRTVRNMYRQIAGYCSMACPQICVYAADAESSDFSAEMRTEIRFDHLMHKEEWRNLSNRIVNCIYAANKPYTSFITAYFQFGSNTVFEQLQVLPSLHRIDNSHPTQKEYGLQSFYYYEERADREAVFQLCSLGEGIRVYKQSRTSGLTVIPYVFLKEMTVEDAWQLTDAAAACLMDSMPLVYDALTQKPQEGKAADIHRLLEYKMRLLTCVLSSLYWDSFVIRHALTWEEYEMDFDTLDKSFGFDVAGELRRMSEADMQKLLKLSFDFTVRHKDSSGVAEQGLPDKATDCALQKALTSVFDASEKDSTLALMQHYFHKNWYLDEMRAASREDRCIGLTVDRILEEGRKHGKQKEEILGWLVNSWDCGIATASFTVNEKNETIGCCNTSGEQSYKIVLEVLPGLMMSLIFVSKIIRKTDKAFIESGLTFETYREAKLVELLDRFRSTHRLRNDWYQDIENIIRQEKGYLNAWNQTGIIWNFMGDYPGEDKCLVEEFVINNL